MAYPIKKRHDEAGLRFLFRTFGTVFSFLTGRLFYYLWFRVRRLNGEKSRALMEQAGFTRELIHIHGQRIAVYRKGHGPSVLLMHGWSGYSGQFEGWLPPLIEAGFQVIAFDSPGHGDSSGHRTNLLEMNDIVHELQARHGSFHGVIAHSFGGVVGLYAASRGLTVNRFVTVSVPADAELLVERTAFMLDIPVATLAVFYRLVEKRFGKDWWFEISPQQTVKQIEIPGLIIHDRQDRAVPAEEAGQIHQNWPASRLLLTQKRGHLKILSDPQVIQQAIAFLRSAKPHVE